LRRKKVRTVWDDKEEKWYFSVLDVVEVLTDSANPTDYFKKMRKREPELAAFVGTNCPHVEMPTASGKKRKIITLLVSKKAKTCLLPKTTKMAQLIQPK